MFKRLRRALRSFICFFVSSIEDPELILEQNIRDLNDQVPKMNESIAMVRANVTLLEKENAKYKQEKERKTQEAMHVIRDARRAQWQAKVADALESFEVGGIDATHDEMIRKVEEQTAINEARMEMALESVDHQAVAIEEQAEKMQAEELVKQFKVEMGLATPGPMSDSVAGPEKTIGKKVEVK